MPASAIVRVCCFSPCLSVTFSLRACSNNRLRLGNSDGGLRLAPLGLPLWPFLNMYSLGGRPGPTLYSSADAGVAETVFCPLFSVDDGLEAMIKSFRNLIWYLARTLVVMVWSSRISEAFTPV